MNKKIFWVFAFVFIVPSILFVGFIFSFFRQQPQISQLPPLKSQQDPVVSVSLPRDGHMSVGCYEDPNKEYILDQKEQYTLLLLCKGYADPSDRMLSKLYEDVIFLKDKESETYYFVTSYERPMYIEAIAYPRIFVRWQGEGSYPPGMIELSLESPYTNSWYWDIGVVLSRNDLDRALFVVNKKIIVAGERKIAEFDPLTFGIKILFEVKKDETIGTMNVDSPFRSSLKKIDDNYVQIKVYKGQNEYTTDSAKEEYTKVIEIK